MEENFINKLLVGNALTKLRHMSDESIDLIIISPPYWNAVVYDKDTNTDYETYLNLLTEIFTECLEFLDLMEKWQLIPLLCQYLNQLLNKM